jgi:hypothetical protein
MLTKPASQMQLRQASSHALQLRQSIDREQASIRDMLVRYVFFSPFPLMSITVAVCRGADF